MDPERLLSVFAARSEIGISQFQALCFLPSVFFLLPSSPRKTELKILLPELILYITRIIPSSDPINCQPDETMGTMMALTAMMMMMMMTKLPCTVETPKIPNLIDGTATPIIFDAGSEVDMAILRRWWHVTVEAAHRMSGYDEQTLSTLLHNESCSADKKESACPAFLLAHEKAAKQCLQGLMKSECVAVFMYSMSSFYKPYAAVMRNQSFESYEIFNALLYTALAKTSRVRPLAEWTTLYRGSKIKYTISVNGRFYFRQFSSTSYNESTARSYGVATLLVFSCDLPRLAANLSGMTEAEEFEVLVSPFEAFETVSQIGEIILLKRSRVQDFAESTAAGCFGSPVSASILALLLLLLHRRCFSDGGCVEG